MTLSDFIEKVYNLVLRQVLAGFYGFSINFIDPTFFHYIHYIDHVLAESKRDILNFAIR